MDLERGRQWSRSLQATLDACEDDRLEVDSLRDELHAMAIRAERVIGRPRSRPRGSKRPLAPSRSASWYPPEDGSMCKCAVHRE
jgi:hypothetical protein